MGTYYILSAILVPLLGALAYYLLEDYRGSKAEIRSIQTERATEKAIYLAKMKSIDAHFDACDRDIDELNEMKKDFTQKFIELGRELSELKGEFKNHSK